MITIKLYGIAKEITGGSPLTIEEGISTVNDLLNFLRVKYPAFQDLTSLLVAVNDEYAQGKDLIKENDSVAIIPPVSGG